jgi:cyanophycinase
VKEAKGTLILSGGNEATENEPKIMETISQAARRKRNGRLVVITVAQDLIKETNDKYRGIFIDSGVEQIDFVVIKTREDAQDEVNVACVKAAAVVFFTGGDQLRVTSQIGDTPLFHALRDFYRKGGTIAGTSSGAAVMSDTMLIGGPGDESNRVSNLMMAPGLGLVQGLVIDSHFAERGRIGRLIGAVTQNPANLGLGLDEDTAVVLRDEHFEVIGSGAVYVVDGANITYSSLSESDAEGIVTVYELKMHVLGAGHRFDLSTAQPSSRSDT